jgi:hypothetical protein
MSALEPNIAPERTVMRIHPPHKTRARRFRAAALALGIIAPLGVGACQTTYDFDAVELGKDDASRAPRPKSNSQFVRAVYADVLGRAPEVYNFVVADQKGKTITQFPIDEQKMLLDALDAVGDTDALRAIVVAGLAQSTEASLPNKDDVSPAAFVTEQFHHYLGREPTAYELSAFVSAWKQDPAVGPRVVVRALVGSREYQSD